MGNPILINEYEVWGLRKVGDGSQVSVELRAVGSGGGHITIVVDIEDAPTLTGERVTAQWFREVITE